MSREPSTSASRGLRTLLESGTTAGLSDAQLLRRYVDRRAEAEAAFGALVDRHGPMVWGVCRRALGRSPEAEDAFQATFLVLARRADAVRVDGSLGRWLYGVASKVAIKARAVGRRGLAREARGVEVEPAGPAPDPERAELLAALDEELNRLPEKYRSPMVLCHLEGLTYAEAAERLGCPPGAIKGRLARGLERLRARLTRRGLALPIPTLGASLVNIPRPAGPPGLAGPVVRAASAAGHGVPASVLTLANGVLRTMFLTRLSPLLLLLASAPVGLAYLTARPAPVPAAKATAPLVVPREVAPALADEPGPPSTTLAGPLPARGELRDLLRRAAEEATALASKDPQPCAGTLATIAQVQAGAGDLDGARTTFAVAVRAAGGDLGGPAYPANLLYVGQAQAEVGFRDEAGATFRRALEVVPGFARDVPRDLRTLNTLVELVKGQAGLGDRTEARRAADRLRAFVADYFARSESTNAEDASAPVVAGALAAVDDFEGAFRRVKATSSGDRVAAEAALAAARYLDKDRARRYVAEAVARIAASDPPFGKGPSLQELAKAQARLGDYDAAKATARSIAQGPPRADDPLPDDWTWALSAMMRIADEQRDTGHLEAARETLRETHRMADDHFKAQGPQAQFQGIAAVQVDLGDFEGALRSVESAPEGGRAATLARIGRAQALAGRGDEARKSIDRALAEARTMASPPPKPNAKPQPTARARPPGADPFASITIGKFEVFSGTDPKPIAGIGPSAVASMELAEVQAMAGDTPEALRTLRALGDGTDRGFALRRIVSARAAAGDVKGALDLATREARTADERRLALEGVGGGIEARLKLEPR